MRTSIAFTAIIACLTSATASAQEAGRPDGTTFGIGVGWTFPQSILEPNTVSLRARFDRLTIEPSISLGGNTTGTASESRATTGDQPPVENEDEDRTSGLNFGVAGNIRYTFVSKGAFDFVGIAGVGAVWSSSTTDNDVHQTDRVNRTRTNAFNTAVSWGVGIEWFVRDNLSISADAQNPLWSYSSSSTVTEVEQTVADQRQTSRNETRQSGFNYGLRIQPSARVLVHLYF